MTEAEIVGASFREVAAAEEPPSVEEMDIDDLLDLTNIKVSLRTPARCAVRVMTEDGKIVDEEESIEDASSHSFDLRNLRPGRKYKLEIVVQKGNIRLIKRITHALPDEETLTKKTYKKKIRDVFYGKGRWVVRFMGETVVEWEQ